MARLDKAIAYLYTQADLGSAFKAKARKLMIAEM
jgi:hypothetical protein